LSVFAPPVIDPSGLVEEERGETTFGSPKYFLGNAVPPNDIRIRENGDTIVFYQVGKSLKLLPPDVIF